MAVAVKSDVEVRLAEAAWTLGVSQWEVAVRILDAHLPAPGMGRCGMCVGTGIVHTGGQTKSCPQCGGSGVY